MFKDMKFRKTHIFYVSKNEISINNTREKSFLLDRLPTMTAHFVQIFASRSFRPSRISQPAACTCNKKLTKTFR